VTAPGCAIENTAAVALESEAPKTELMLSTPSIEFNLHLAPGHRYVVRRQALAPVPAGQVEPAQPEVKLGTVPVALNRAVGLPMPNRAPAVPLNFRATVRKPRAARMMVPAEFAGPQFDDVKPMLPVCRENPLEGSLEPPPKRTLLSSWMQRSNGAHQKHVWTNAVDFWQHAPRDLKLVAVAIPVLLGLALHPSLPKVRVTASPRATNEIENGFTRNLRTQFVNVKRTVAERAGVALNEDFRSGLEEWQSRGERPTTWSFDTTGFVRPASLAVYRPSMVLTDYEMEFLGLIDKKALSWVVRAQDFDNFYVVKLVVLKPGPLPTIGLTRYAVVNGKAQDRVDKVLPVSVRPDMLYRVSMNVHGDTYLLALQGEIVDNWSEPRLTHGGIGFFAPRGEESRLRWVQVTHQYDMLGRLCAYLAPYNIPTNGSW
jgi:hypothetical protein